MQIEILTGTGIIINNLDLYFQEVFTDKTCQILVPYFLSKESNNLKDIVEVNTAVALAFNGLGYGEKDIDYASGQFENMAQSEMLKKKFEEAKKKAIEFYDKYIKSGKPKKKSAKRKVEFNDEVVETSDGMPPMVEYGENISTAEEDI